MKLRQKPSGIWVVDFEDAATGQRRRVSTNLRDKAEATKRAREIVLGIDVKPVDGLTPTTEPKKAGTTLEDVFRMCERAPGPWCPQNAKSQRTIKSNLKVLEALMVGPEGGQKVRLAGLPVGEVSYTRLEQAQAALLAMGYKPATVKRKMDMVGRALTYAMSKDLIAGRPQVPGLKVVSQRTRVLKPDEEALLFALIEKRILAEPQRPWVRFKHLLAYLLDTACRLGEALALESDWVATITSKGQPRVTVAIPAHVTKTGKGRNLPLSQRIVDSLTYLRITAVGGRLFPMTASTAWYMFSNLKEEALAAHGVDLGDVVLHTMRHTRITRLLQAGMPLVKVSKWAGHANIKITAGTYGHLEVDDLMDGVDLIDGSEPAAGLRAVS